MRILKEVTNRESSFGVKEVPQQDRQSREARDGPAIASNEASRFPVTEWLRPASDEFDCDLGQV
jgi:hypothetical protein